MKGGPQSRLWAEGDGCRTKQQIKLLRVVLGSCTQCCPCEAMEKKWPKNWILKERRYILAFNTIRFVSTTLSFWLNVKIGCPLTPIRPHFARNFIDRQTDLSANRTRIGHESHASFQKYTRKRVYLTTPCCPFFYFECFTSVPTVLTANDRNRRIQV